MSSSQNEEVSPSGIRTAEGGQRYVGGSMRKDGTVRRTAKVKPGFVPAGDIKRYVPGAFRELRARNEVKSFQNKDSDSKSRVNDVKSEVSPTSANSADDQLVGSTDHKPKGIRITYQPGENSPSSKDKKEPVVQQEASLDELDELDAMLSNVTLSSTSPAESNKSVYVPPWKRRSESAKAKPGRTSIKTDIKDTKGKASTK